MSVHSGQTLPPQLLRNVPLLTFFLAVDPARLAAVVPPPLRVHPNGRLILNMWYLPDVSEMTGFGAPGEMGITYLAMEVTGEEGASSDGAVRFPARYWLRHWGSLPAAREYARRASGLEIEPGDTSLTFDGGVATAALTVNGQRLVTARMRVDEKKERTLGGFSLYYAQRSANGGQNDVSRFDVPWISDVFAAQDPEVEFSFPARETALAYVGNGPQTIEAFAFRRMTLVPYISTGTVAQP